MTSKSNTQGLTLIEIAIVVAIIGVLAALSAPSFLTWVSQYRLRSDTQDLIANIQLARIQAISGNENIYFVFNSAGRSYLFQNATTTLQTATLSTGVRFGSGPGGSTALNGIADDGDGISFTGALTFQPSGRGGIDAVIFLTNTEQNKAYAIEIKRYGKMATYRWGGTGWQR